MTKSTTFTPEQRAEASRKAKEAWAILTDEEKAARIAKAKENNHQTPMTDEEKAEASRKGKEAWEALTDEEKAARIAKAKENNTKVA